MANEFRDHPSHSAEHFGDSRDHWWNLDFLQLISKRLSLNSMHRVLDVGCGVGHWGRLLAAALPGDVEVLGVDRDPFWVEKASERAAAAGLAHRFHYCESAAERLPFEGSTFDLVTCQTLLIHVRDPGIVIDEMIRVARPGGLILAAEPNNIANSLIFDSLNQHDPIDEIMARTRLQLICERGKFALGEGNNSLGDQVPALLARHGLIDIRVYLNDKVVVMLPPYETAEQRAWQDSVDDDHDRKFWIWSRPETQRYFLAGGGRPEDFEALWDNAKPDSANFKQAIGNKTYAAVASGIFYLVAGTKP
jgi:SAM-dependent methyltransferase